MKTKLLHLLSLFAIFISCSNPNNYSQFVDFGEDNRWQKDDARTFDFDITDAQTYNLTFRFSHVYDYQFATVPINFTIENPAGEMENFTVDLAIKDSAGEELAECGGDVCDLKYSLKEKQNSRKENTKLPFRIASKDHIFQTYWELD